MVLTLAPRDLTAQELRTQRHTFCRQVQARAQGPVTIEDIAALKGCTVLPVRGGPACSAGSLIAPEPQLTLLIFFTHWCVFAGTLTLS